MVILCSIKDLDTEDCWHRKIDFPFPPFQGLRVGYYKVKRVAVCQGNLDGQGEILVDFKAKEIGAVHLRANGWHPGHAMNAEDCKLCKQLRA